jgi:hypothetical protein
VLQSDNAIQTDPTGHLVRYTSSATGLAGEQSSISGSGVAATSKEGLLRPETVGLTRARSHCRFGRPLVRFTV